MPPQQQPGHGPSVQDAVPARLRRYRERKSVVGCLGLGFAVQQLPADSPELVLNAQLALFNAALTRRRPRRACGLNA